MTYVVIYPAIFGDTERVFGTHARAAQWLRQVGRPELIHTITATGKDAIRAQHKGSHR